MTSRGVILTFEEGVLGMEAYGWERSAETPHGAVYIGPGKKGRITINWNGIKDPYTISRIVHQLKTSHPNATAAEFKAHAAGKIKNFKRKARAASAPASR